MAPNLDFAREFRNAVPDVLRRADEAGLTKLLDAADAADAQGHYGRLLFSPVRLLRIAPSARCSA